MDLDAALVMLATEPQPPLDIAEVALHLARDEYPGLDVEAYLCELSGMAREARTFLRGNLQCRVSGLCRYLFHEMGFRGNAQDYYDPRNSYFNEVLDRRTGIPITLSAVVMALGQRVGIDIEGIGLPGHFVVRAVAKEEVVLFDPFHAGRKLDPSDCENLVRKVTGKAFQATSESLRGLPLKLIISRMLTNLKVVYLQKENYTKAAKVMERLCQINPHDLREKRDLGAVLLQAGRAGQAIDHLNAYLKSAPPCADADQVRQLLHKALASIGQWN